MTHRQKQLVSLAASIGLAASLVLPTVAFGATVLNANNIGLNVVGNTIAGGGSTQKDPRTIAANLINVALGFLGIIAVVIVLLGGFKYMTAGGEEEKTTEAKKLIVSGIIGMAIILSAWAVTGFVIGSLINTTQ